VTRLDRYKAYMMAQRRKQSRFASSDDQYAWASIDPDKYGGSPQEDMGNG
jgi:hypothetical protein